MSELTLLALLYSMLITTIAVINHKNISIYMGSIYNIVRNKMKKLTCSNCNELIDIDCLAVHFRSEE